MFALQTIHNVLPMPLPINHRQHCEQTIRRAYASWRQRFPRWVNTGFDEYFLLHDALPLLREMLQGERYPDPAQLAQKWVVAYGIPAARVQPAVAELTPVAADFLAHLQIEYSHPSA
ncbi:MAG: hypothetical protein KJZ93_18015 [Caldilineaceae bacterium]|nr:hypothetical protein [Caldilineaceae bacterium]